MKPFIVPKEKVVNEWLLPFEWKYQETSDKIEVLSDIIVAHRRWSVEHQLTVSINGEVFITQYSVAATENQEEQPWDYQTEITFYPAKLTTVERWVAA